MPSVDKLMRGLDKLDHHERMVGLVAHVRGLSPAVAQELLVELSGGDVHRRWLALHVAKLLGDVGYAERALEDPSLMVRRLAAWVFGRLTESLPEDLFDRVDDETLGRLFAVILRRGRRDIARATVEGLLARERVAEAGMLLSACEPTWIAAQLDAHAWPASTMLRLAKHRPEILCARIAEQFAAAELPMQVFARHGHQVWSTLCETRPEEIAGFIDRFVDKDEFPFELFFGMTRLSRVMPDRVIGWLSTRPAWLARVGVSRALAARVRGLGDALVGPLCRALVVVQPAGLAVLFRRLPYPRRARLFEDAIGAIETALVEWPIELLALLPVEVRQREAKRMLKLQRATVDGTWRRALLGMLDIEQARPALEEEARSTQAVERGEAWAALVGASGRARAPALAETLTMLARIKNDQDPVRMLVLGALAALPGQRFDDPKALDLVVAPIFEARDTSWATRHHAARIAHALLIARALEPGSPMFQLGLSLLERLAGHQGTPDLPRLDRNLPRGAEQAIVETLLPWMEAARSRQQDQHVLSVWSALGKRAWRVPQLGTLVAEVMWRGHKSRAATAATMWLADPATRDARVQELVRKDRSAIYLHAVFEHCQRRRQTLLDKRMATRAPRGRFHDGKVVYLPWVRGGYERWPTSLQEAYVRLIEAAEAQPKQFGTTRAGLIHARALVPVTRVEDLESAVRSKDVLVSEAALGALIWTDAPAAALPVLLGHLESDRARVAMYAMPRLARVLPRAQLVKALAGLLGRPKLRVTVHKEVLRLLGVLGTPEAIELLGGAWASPLHRDVRIAALHAARNVPWAAQAFTIFEEAARDDVEVARALVGAPIVTVAERHRGRYLEKMLIVAEHPSPIARAELFASLANRWSWVDPLASMAVAARVVRRLDPGDPWQVAARIVAGTAHTTATHVGIVELVLALADAADLAIAPSGEDDRLAHRRLAVLVAALENERHPVSRMLQDKIADELLARPDWWTMGARLRVAASKNAELGERLLALVGSAPSIGARRSLDGPAVMAGNSGARDWSQGDALAVLDRLFAGDAAARLLAVTLLECFGRRWRWGVVFTDPLARARADEDLDVRTRARSLWLDSR